MSDQTFTGMTLSAVACVLIAFGWAVTHDSHAIIAKPAPATAVHTAYTPTAEQVLADLEATRPAIPPKQGRTSAASAAEAAPRMVVIDRGRIAGWVRVSVPDSPMTSRDAAVQTRPQAARSLVATAAGGSSNATLVRGPAASAGRVIVTDTNGSRHSDRTRGARGGNGRRFGYLSRSLIRSSPNGFTHTGVGRSHGTQQWWR